MAMLSWLMSNLGPIPTFLLQDKTFLFSKDVRKVQICNLKWTNPLILFAWPLSHPTPHFLESHVMLACIVTRQKRLEKLSTFILKVEDVFYSSMYFRTDYVRSFFTITLSKQACKWDIAPIIRTDADKDQKVGHTKQQHQQLLL